MTRLRTNTIAIIYEEPGLSREYPKRVSCFAVSLLGATLVSWSFLLLIYEVSCVLGNSFELNHAVINAAVRADQEVVMEYRTDSYVLDRLIHELEEMKLFYSRI